MHRRSAILPQVFHTRVGARLLGVWIVLCLTGLATPIAWQHAQADAPTATHRIFLTSGDALPAYGDYARLDDRVVFTLFLGEGGKTTTQLMSLPIGSVDLERTAKYSEGVRAAHYAETRGEVEYVAITNEVARAIDQLSSIEDKKKRLDLAEEARRRLLAWSRTNYHYRARDVRELAALFDEVIAELKTAAGESSLSFDVQSGPAAPEYEPRQPAPGLRASIQLALSASMAADVLEDRLAVLRAAQLALADAADVADLRDHVTRTLEQEITASTAYAALTTDLTSRADAAMRQGNVAALDALLTELGARDQALGGRRPEIARSLSGSLLEMLERARAHRLALDHYVFVRPALLKYEHRVRHILGGVEKLGKLLKSVRRQDSVPVQDLDAATRTLTVLLRDLDTARPPEDVLDVHATLSSALQLAREACRQRRLAVMTRRISYAQDASAAAAGALLLAAQTRKTLAQRLFPPAFQ